MRRQLIYKKMEYYCQWYKSLTEQEQESWLGEWVMQNLDYYFRALLS